MFVVMSDVNAWTFGAEKIDNLRTLVVDALSEAMSPCRLGTVLQHIIRASLALLPVLTKAINPDRHAEAFLKVHIVVGMSTEAIKGHLDYCVVISFVTRIQVIGLQAEKELGAGACGCAEYLGLPKLQLEGLDVHIHVVFYGILSAVVATDMDYLRMLVADVDIPSFSA